MSALPNRLSAFNFNRTWQLGTVLFAAFGLIALAAWLLLPSHQSLVWLWIYTAVSNFFIPWLPHEPMVLLYGTLYDPWLVALVAGIATVWIEFFNYQLLKPLLNVSRIKKLTAKRLYQKVEHWFRKVPFFALVFAGASPVPYAPFRVFAVNSGYPLDRYLLAVFIGRTPRYYLLALTGAAIRLPPWAYGLFFAILLGIIFWGRIMGWREKLLTRQEATPEPTGTATH